MKKLLTLLAMFIMNIACFSGILGSSFRQLWVQKNLSCPDDNHPHAIDLGLPSGTKWACCNIGADNPTEYGGRYSWGETETKDYYYISTYLYCDGTEKNCYYIGDDIAGTDYDVAHVEWGGSWRMPSLEQFKELIDYCSSGWMQNLKGYYGLLIMGPNGNTIYLPAVGVQSTDELTLENEYGYYWSSCYDPDSRLTAYHFTFKEDKWGYGSKWFRFFGLPVRPIRK